jgi:predicted nucleotidyltransferase
MGLRRVGAEPFPPFLKPYSGATRPFSNCRIRWKKQLPGYILQGMRRDEVITKLKETEPALKAFGVAALYLFGSHARDEAGPDSDVDVFVDPAADRTFGFLPFMDAYAAIQKVFGDQVEIGYSTRTGLSPYILEDVEREAVRIF